VDYGELILPALLTLIPPIVFCLGAGMMLSRFNHTLIYALMAAVILLTVLPLPPAINFSLRSFFSQFPLTAEKLDPAFHVPGWLAVHQMILTALGTFLAVFAVHAQRNSSCQTM
jgi:ABC-2 type transport system permease protein